MNNSPLNSCDNKRRISEDILLCVNAFEHLKNIFRHITILMHSHGFSVNMHVNVLTVLELSHVESRLGQIRQILSKCLIVYSYPNDITQITNEFFVLNFEDCNGHRNVGSFLEIYFCSVPFMIHAKYFNQVVID